MFNHLADAHSQWHSVYGRDTVCPLDCGIGDTLNDEDYPPLVKCGHCGCYETVEEVRKCSRL